MQPYGHAIKNSFILNSIGRLLGVKSKTFIGGFISEEDIIELNTGRIQVIVATIDQISLLLKMNLLRTEHLKVVAIDDGSL